ncbi:MAG: GIY-YIG nuclease family protein [Elusimicrobia bacterium]|jgi:hypothetical protein|nr:GIY-YIG nuclease family protein [Elusimicrobiota bacterium]
MIDKKRIKREYKETVQPMGIYKITNKVSGKILIGKSKNIPGKINRFKFQLNMGSHMNHELQKDYKEIGENNFLFESLDTLKPKGAPDYDYSEDLKMLEEMWLGQSPLPDPNGFEEGACSVRSKSNWLIRRQ